MTNEISWIWIEKKHEQPLIEKSVWAGEGYLIFWGGMKKQFGLEHTLVASQKEG